jgi:hypothetical protein
MDPLRRISMVFMRRISYENSAKLQENLIQQVSINRGVFLEEN